MSGFVHDLPIAATDLPRDHFPVVIECRDESSGELLWREVVRDAGALRVPGFWPRKVSTSVHFAHGYSVTTDSAGNQIAVGPERRS